LKPKKTHASSWYALPGSVARVPSEAHYHKSSHGAIHEK